MGNHYGGGRYFGGESNRVSLVVNTDYELIAGMVVTNVSEVPVRLSYWDNVRLSVTHEETSTDEHASGSLGEVISVVKVGRRCIVMFQAVCHVNRLGGYYSAMVYAIVRIPQVLFRTSVDGVA